MKTSCTAPDNPPDRPLKGLQVRGSCLTKYKTEKATCVSAIWMETASFGRNSQPALLPDGGTNLRRKAPQMDYIVSCYLSHELSRVGGGYLHALLEHPQPAVDHEVQLVLRDPFLG